MKKLLMLAVLAGCGENVIPLASPIKGEDGVDGTNGENGTDGINGADGEDGLNGADGADGLDGAAGVAGANGTNGLSLVSQSRSATVIECPSSLGTAVDIFVDFDNSFTVTPGDVFQSGLVACNGVAGSNGSNAVASVTGFNFTGTTACRDLGFNLSGAKTSTTSNNVRLYPNSTCQGSHINELAEGSDEIYYASDSVIYILEGNNSGTIAPLSIRRLVFNL